MILNFAHRKMASEYKLFVGASVCVAITHISRTSLFIFSVPGWFVCFHYISATFVAPWDLNLLIIACFFFDIFADQNAILITKINCSKLHSRDWSQSNLEQKIGEVLSCEIEPDNNYVISAIQLRIMTKNCRSCSSQAWKGFL